MFLENIFRSFCKGSAEQCYALAITELKGELVFFITDVGFRFEHIEIFQGCIVLVPRHNHDAVRLCVKYLGDLKLFHVCRLLLVKSCDFMRLNDVEHYRRRQDHAVGENDHEEESFSLLCAEDLDVEYKFAEDEYRDVYKASKRQRGRE